MKQVTTLFLFLLLTAYSFACDGSISQSDTICLGSGSYTVHFTGSGGVAPYTFEYTVNGGPVQTISSGTNDFADLTATIPGTGNFHYTLIQVSDGAGCMQAVNQSIDILIATSPSATISGTTTAYQNSTPFPIVTFTGTGGVPSYTFYYTLNNGPVQSITSAAGSSQAFLPISTAALGTYVVQLVGVQDALACSGPGSGPPANGSGSGGGGGTPPTFPTATVNIIPNPPPLSGTASISQGCGHGVITLTASGGNGTYTYTFTLNGITMTQTGGASLTTGTSSAGLYTLSGVSVSSGGQTAPLSGGGSVYSFPSASLNISASATTVCVNDPSPVITLSSFIPDGGTLAYQAIYLYSVNGISHSAAATPHEVLVYAPTNIPGSYTYSLNGVNGTCAGNPASVTIIVNPLPTATVSGASACLNTGNPVVTFTGSIGSMPSWWPLPSYTFTYNLNGGPNQTVSATPGSTTATIPVPTNIVGTYTYNLVSVSSAGCSQNQTGSATVTINPIPTATMDGTTTVCRNSASPVISFTGANGSVPYIFTYKVNGGPNQTAFSSAGNTATVNAPTGTAGTFTYTLVSVSSNGCSQLQTGTATITVTPLPTATISGTGAVCRNAALPVVTFTGANGTAPYVFTYKVNGGANQTVSSGAGNTATVAVPTGTDGTFVYSLVNVASANTCFQNQAGSATIIIRPLPEATVSGTSATCLNTPSTIAFTGSVGTAPYTFTYTVNGGSSQTVSSGTGSTAAVSVPATAEGTFVYDLGAVSDANGCFQSQAGSAAITVLPLPTATIAGATTVCLGDPDSEITFTGSDGTAPYIFTYNIDGGANQTVSSGALNSAAVSVPTTNAGTFTCNLVSVSSFNGCSQSITDAAAVIVTPLPTAVVSGNATVCQNAPDPVVTFTGTNGIAPYTFTYNIDGGADQTVSSGTGNTAAITISTTTAGTISCYLLSVSSGSGCFQAQAGTATIVVSDLPVASISANGSACQNGTAPQVVFTGSGGTAPYQFTYSINGGSSQTTLSGATATVSVPTSTAGSFSYDLTGVTDAAGCTQAQSGTGVFTIHPLPIITGLNDICPGSTLQLTGDGTPDATSPWLSSNLAAATIDNTGLVTAGSTGTSSITYTNSNGCSTTSAVTVLAPPVAAISGSSAICAGNAASFTISGTPNSTVIYTDGTSSFTTVLPASGNAPIVSASLNSTTSYTLVSVQSPAPASCVALLSASITITVKPIPVADPLSDISACAGSQVAVPGFSSIPTGATFGWSNSNTATGLGANGTGGINNFTAVNNQPTSEISTVDVIPTLNGCVGQAMSFNITVSSLPTANAGTDQAACVNDGNTYQIGSSPVAGNSYAWSPTAGLNDAVIANPVISNISLATTTYVVTVTNTLGCQNTDTVLLNELALPSVSLDASTHAACKSGTIFFGVNTAGNVSIEWFVDGVHIDNDNETHFSTSFASSGIHTVYIVATNAAGCSVTDSINGGILIYPDVSADFTTLQDITQVNEFTDQLDLINQSENATIYSWYLNGVLFSTDQNPTSFFAPGYENIDIMLIAENQLGCPDTVRLTIIPLSDGLIYVPNTFTPNGDGMNEVFFPVISDNFDLTNSHLEIYNRWGELIFESTESNIGWNGFYKGELCKTDTYVWKLSVKAASTDFVKSLEGHVNLLR